MHSVYRAHLIICNAAPESALLPRSIASGDKITPVTIPSMIMLVCTHKHSQRFIKVTCYCKSIITVERAWLSGRSIEMWCTRLVHITLCTISICGCKSAIDLLLYQVILKFQLVVFESHGHGILYIGYTIYCPMAE